MENVSYEELPRMNLLGLILGNILERNLADPAKKQWLDGLAAEVVITAGEMTVTLRLDHGRVYIARGAPSKPRAQVKGSLDALLNLALGRGMFGLILAGRVKLRGNPFLLLKIRRLLRVQ